MRRPTNQRAINSFLTFSIGCVLGLLALPGVLAAGRLESPIQDGAATPKFKVLPKEPNSDEHPSLCTTQADLTIPPLVEGNSAPGKRTVGKLKPYQQTKVFHTVYLPTDWTPNCKFPVIIEFAGNGPYRNKLGDVCTGKVENCRLGYGISGGEQFIWVCLPFVDPTRQHNQLRWWGDAAATVEYCKQVVADICNNQGGDPDRVFLCGFSRGAIACNYIGLYDDEIAALWCGMICHSHYDGVRRWNYAHDDSVSALRRLRRLKSTPQFICQESSIDATRDYLAMTKIQGDFTFLELPFANHTDRWVLNNIPARDQLRRWVKQVMARKNALD